MCGIIGQINFKKERPMDEAELIARRDQMRHRGPDDAGIYIDGRVGLGFRRLSIIDLSEAGAQPMSNEDGSVRLIFNGEFYNYREHRQELIKRGHRFKSESDSEVIIHLYEEEGIDCLKKINGMFALSIYDRKRQLLFLARDRFGVKPLYYHQGTAGLSFASEIKAIVADRRILREIEADAMYEYFSFGYVAAPRTIYKNIKQVRPAHYLIFDLTQNRIMRDGEYWHLAVSQEKKFSSAEWTEKFMALCQTAVTRRLVSDVPVGVFLSGGVDSSSIVSFLSETSNQPIDTFSVGFEEPEFDETAYSRLVAKKYNTNHHEFIVKPDAIELLPQLAWHYDEPFDDSSAIPTFYLSRLTSSTVKVVLTGDGGDELLAGYPRYRDFNRLNHYVGFVPPAWKKFIFSAAFRKYPDNLRGKRLLYLLSLPTAKAYEEFMRSFNGSEIDQLFSREIKRQIVKPFSFDEITLPERTDLITSLQYLDSKTYLPGDILTKVDRASMAHSLEARSPFLDYELWELVFSMPLSMRFKDGQGKYLLKETMKNRFGPEFVNRDKMGFGVPLNRWFRGSLENFAKEILLEKKFLERGYFNPEYVKKIITIHSQGRRDFSRKIWSLLFFEFWCRNWLD